MEEQQEKTQGKKQDKKLWKIFWSTFYLSAFTWWRLCDRQPDEEKVRR